MPMPRATPEMAVEPDHERRPDRATGGASAGEALVPRRAHVDGERFWIVRHQGRIRLMDHEGRLFLDTPFVDAGVFAARGPVPVKTADGRWGVLRLDGRWAMDPVLDAITGFGDDGRAVAVQGGSMGLVDPEGRWVVPLGVYQDIAETADARGWRLARGAEGQVYLDRNGAAVFFCPFEACGPFLPGGRAGARKDGRWGFMDGEARFIPLPGAEDGTRILGTAAFSDAGGVQAWKEGRQGVVDAEGRWLVPPVFDDLLPMKGPGPFGASQGGRWGAIDAAGRWVVTPRFDHLGNFTNRGLAGAQLEGRFGLIDQSGAWILPPQYRGINAPDAAHALVPASDARGMGLLDLAGTWIVPPGPDTILMVEDGHYLVMGADETTLLDPSGRPLDAAGPK